MRAPFSADSAIDLRIIAACVIPAVAGTGHLAYLVEGIGKAVWLKARRWLVSIQPRHGNLDSLRGSRSNKR
jgi:hypothetical protein